MIFGKGRKWSDPSRLNVSSREHFDTESGNYLVSIISPDVAWRVARRDQSLETFDYGRTVRGNRRMRAISLRGRCALGCVISARLVLWERRQRSTVHRPILSPPSLCVVRIKTLAESIYINKTNERTRH